MKKTFKHSICIAFLICIVPIYAQEGLGDRNWDNILYVSNKISFGATQWRHTFEYQGRYANNMRTSEAWLVEYAAVFLARENWEIIPDLRYTRKPTRNEFRPGLGVIYKNLFTKSQLVHQVKYQFDIKDGPAANSHGLRYALFYNKVYNDNIIVTALAGALFEFGPDWDGFLGMRAGLSAGYVFNKAHSVNVGYFYGLINEKTNDYMNVGVFSIQLIINIQKDYKYLPAKYISF